MTIDYSEDSKKYGVFGVTHDGNGHIEMVLPAHFVGHQMIGMHVESARTLAKALEVMCDEADKSRAKAAAEQQAAKKPGQLWPEKGIMAAIGIDAAEGHVVLTVPAEMIGGIGIYPDAARDVGMGLIKKAYDCDGRVPFQELVGLLRAAERGAPLNPIPPTTNQRN